MKSVFQLTLQRIFGQNERVKQVRVATAIGMCVGLIFSVFNIFTKGMLILGLIELGAVVLLVIPAMAVSRAARWVSLSEFLLLLAAIVIFSALIVLGGIEATGLFWVYTLPFLAFFLKGQRQGWWYSLIFWMMATLYLMRLAPLMSFAHVYTPVVASHFVLSLGFYTLVASAFDYVRSRHEAELLQAKNALEVAYDELRQAKEKSEAAYAAKSRFLAAASHDLRQPAHALGMFVARLSQLPHAPASKELVTGVVTSVQALQEMLDVFFDYSRLDALSTQITASVISTDALFKQLGVCFSNIAAQKGIRLCIRKPSCAWVQSDPVLLQRVLLNLVSNALRYTPQGSVLVCCRPTADGTQARIEVWDSGIGIAAVHQEKIYEEFFQVENQERDRTKGLGLGLSMVARSCQLLNHRLALRSALGCGSRFTLTVPVATSVAELGHAQVDEKLVQGSLENLHVLLIEDDQLGRTALCSLLQSWGCRVTAAVDAGQARDLLSQVPPVQFVVSDYRLPGAHNGIDAIRMLRAIAGPALGACLISGDTDQQVLQQANAAQLVLLKKPLQPAKLSSLLRRWMRLEGSSLKTQTEATGMDNLAP
ncbi:sensor protein TorS [mine drainage metagenome]|uniref:histidine kinase n=1 Tax=mine drainage metagenome TaxID=410659 RepID=A0A1J5Q5Y6_9ZZZZ